MAETILGIINTFAEALFEQIREGGDKTTDQLARSATEEVVGLVADEVHRLSGGVVLRSMEQDVRVALDRVSGLKL